MENKFRFFKPIVNNNKFGFILPNQEIYFYDSYGGWIDNQKWYNNDAVEQGIVNKNGIYYPYWTQKSGEHYKAGPLVVERIVKGLRKISKRINSDQATYIIKIYGLPQEYDVQDYIKYMVFVGNLKNGTILDCKRLHSKMHSEYFCQMTVKGLQAATNCILQEGKLLMLQKHGDVIKYRIHIDIYNENIFETMENFGYQKEQIQRNEYNQSYYIHFANLSDNLDSSLVITQLAQKANISINQFQKLTRSNVNSERGLIQLNSIQAQKKLAQLQIEFDGRQIILRI